MSRMSPTPEVRMPAPTVEFGSDVPQELYDEFKRRFPQYGAVKWFINSSLSAFLDATREMPEVSEVIDSQIRSMWEGNRAR